MREADSLNIPLTYLRSGLDKMKLGLTIQEERKSMPNPITWFELIGTDPIKLQKFYKDVFNWKLGVPAGPEMGNYSMLDNEKKGIGGGVGGAMDGKPRVTIYIEVDSPKAYLTKATKAGAKVIMPETTVMEGVTIAMFTDPAGNIMGLLKSTK